MTTHEALKKGTDILRYAEVEAPVMEAGVILCHVLDCDRSYLYTHGSRTISDDKSNEFFKKIQSRAEGMPVQYITGHQEFMSLDFTVAQGVLIPRHDTEVLVETVIEHVKKLSILNSQLSTAPKVRILDLGTGSGCIAVSLAYYIENCEVTAADISQKALEVARSNASRAGVEGKITFVCGDLFAGLHDIRAMKNSFDVIVSNPPYIPTIEIGGLQREVKDHEPVIALDGGSDGLHFYRRITKGAVEYLEQDGVLAFEVGYNQAHSVSAIMSDMFYNIGIIKDIASIERVVKGQLKEKK